MFSTPDINLQFLTQINDQIHLDKFRLDCFYPVTPNSFLLCSENFCKTDLNCVRTKWTYKQPFLNCLQTMSLLKSFCCLFRSIIRWNDNALHTRWMHYKQYRHTSILFETWSSWASTGSAFAFYGNYSSYPNCIPFFSFVEWRKPI